MKIHRLAGAIALLACAASAHASLISDFNAGAAGWSGGGGSPALSYQSSGGVGDTGYLRVVDTAGGQMIVKSGPFGVQSALYGGLLSFDYDVFGLQNGNVYTPNNPFGIVTLYSGALSVSADLIANIPVSANIAGSGWHTASLGLQNGLWSGNATLSTILANLTSVAIDVEYDRTQRWPDEIVGVDNVRLTSPGTVTPAAVPEPGIDLLLVAGIVGLAVGARRRRPARGLSLTGIVRN